MSGLIVVDMQPEFTGSNNGIVKRNVRELIRRYRMEWEPIFIVEYRGQSPTHEELVCSLYDYKNVHWIRKDLDDGSDWVDHLITKCNLPIKDLVVCGVNASFCVYQTARGLVEMGYRVIVPEEATTNAPEQLDEDWKIEAYGPTGLKPLQRFSQDNTNLKLSSIAKVLTAKDLSEVINL